MSASDQPPLTSTSTSTSISAKGSISSSLKNDPLLSQFLSEDFSPTIYLNRSLQPSSQPSSSQTQQHQQQQRTSTTTTGASSHNAASLSNLHSIASSLLSELDVHLNRLQATLSGLTDDILRVTPRLGYEVEVLRSDIVSVAETLSSEDVERLMAQLEISEPVFDEDGEVVVDNTTAAATTTNGNVASAEGEDTKKKKKKKKEGEDKKAEESLQRLRMLVKVRDHLDEVIRIFGDAMEWTLSESQRASSATAAPTGLPSYAPPVTSTIPTAAGGDSAGDKGKISGSEKLEQEINYLVSSNELERASKRVEDISKLLVVWQNTSEYAIRSKFVDNLRWKVLEASKEEELAEDEAAGSHDVDDAMGGGVSSGGGRDGYYSLINQLQRMRGMG